MGFFVVLSLYRYPHDSPLMLNVALGLFILASITDWLDGMLARRWQVISTFGRIMDPFGDKVLVIGAFVCLAGPMFSTQDPATGELLQVSGIWPWMALVVLGRELLVTSIRAFMESKGIPFGASWSGKAKFILQVVAIPVVIFIVAYFDPIHQAAAAWIRDVCIYLTLIVTVISGWPYITRAMHAMTSS